jgi:cyclophilin family peptidyl-prolyl cis-trans isomerase/HEAT repeat protein
LGALLQAADTRQRDTAVVDRGLRSTIPFVRAVAVRSIGQIGISSRAGALRALVADPDSAVAADAAFALGLLHDSSATTHLARALAASPTVAAAASWSLGELGDAGRPMLEEVLRSGRPTASLADVLQASAKLRPVPADLIAPYLSHADIEVRRNAAYALSRSRVASATRALLALERRLAGLEGAATDTGLADAAVDLRSYVARGLSRLVAGDSLGTDALAALRRLVEDRHAHVRINAIRSLGTYGPSARADLVRHLRDPDANARIALAQSLGGVFATPSDDWSAAWAADSGFTYRRALLSTAVRAGVRLAALDPTDTQAWQRRTDWRYRAAAAEAAGAGRVTDIDAIAVPLLRDADPRVRTAAFSAALNWADSASAANKPYARSSLGAALADVDLFVRAAVLDALRPRARASDAAVALDAWRNGARDSENDARLAALRVIASAWTADSSSFGPLRDSLAALQPPSDAVERSAVRNVAPLRHWLNVAVVTRPRQWYVEQAQNFIARSLARGPMRATIATERGDIQLVLFDVDAPLTVANFVQLANRGYYSKLVFHRVVPNFVAQDGDPRGDGSGGPGYAIRDELNRRWYDRGAVGMALSGPDTGGSQYFLAHSPQPHLDGHYTVFGHVTAGLDVLDRLVQGDRILRITIQ